MNDPYLYPHTDVMKNLADIRDREMLSCMEAEYTSIRLAELVTGEPVSRFDFAALCDVHHYIFQDIYEWAGKIRMISIEKSEPALGGISITKAGIFREDNSGCFGKRSGNETKGFGYIKNQILQNNALDAWVDKHIPEYRTMEYYRRRYVGE